VERGIPLRFFLFSNFHFLKIRFDDTANVSARNINKKEVE